MQWVGGRVGPVSRQCFGKVSGRKRLEVSGRAAWPHLGNTSGLLSQRLGILGTSWHVGLEWGQQESSCAANRD